MIGIFMISMSQISSHTMAGVYPPRSARYSYLDRAPDELAPGHVVLRHVEAGARVGEVDLPGSGDPYRKTRKRLVDLGIRALVDADPVRPGYGLDPCVRDGVSAAIAASDVEAGVEEVPVQEPAGGAATPRRCPLAGWVDAAVAGEEQRSAPVGEGEAFSEHADPFDDQSIFRRRWRSAGEKASPERRAANDTDDGDNAARHGLELGGRLAVEKRVRAAILVAPAEGAHEDCGCRRSQPVHPHLATPL